MATVFSRTLGVLAVGVDSCGVFSPLKGAAKGADTICDWALDQRTRFGVTVHIEKFTDVGGSKVSLAHIQHGARNLVSQGLDALIVYLSGHGIVKIGDDEYVLLSDADTNLSAAVSVASTLSAAWLCGVPHVILISDACRSPVLAGTPAARVVGSQVLFATTNNRANAVDVFYASSPYAVTFEVNGEGLLTEELHRALTLPSAGTTASVVIGGQTGTVVVPTPLVLPLTQVIANRAAMLTPPRTLIPDFRVTSAPYSSCFFGLVDLNTVASAVAHPTPSPPTEDLSVQLIGRMSGSLDATAVPPVSPLSRHLAGSAPRIGSVREESSSESVPSSYEAPPPERAGLQFSEHVQRIWRRQLLSNVGHRKQLQSVSSGAAGLFVVGDALHEVICPSAKFVRIFERGNRPLNVILRPSSGRHLGTVALLFKSGTCGFLPVFEGYVGRVVLRHGLIESLSYRFATDIHSIKDQQLDEYVSMAEVLARSGKLNRLSPAEGNHLADRWRQYKQVDPMLGVFASYAYHLSGNWDGARSVFDWMFNGEVAVPFDVCMLAQMSTPEVALRNFGFSPFCPMLTLGWSIAEGLGLLTRLHPAIQELSSKRLNSLYSTFPIEDASDVLTSLRDGELR